MNPAPIKASTQDHLDIEDVKDNLAILKDGSSCIILQTTAVNFSLLSESEQDAIIYAYAGLLNSLTYPIQIVIKSQKKDIGAYLALIDSQKAKMKNPLLKNQMEKYQQFIQKTVSENEVLDKKFYIVIPFSHLELGLSSAAKSPFRKKSAPNLDKDMIIQKAKTTLIPKRDHLINQFTKLGLKIKQLTTPEIIKLLFHQYNPDTGSIDLDPSSEPSASLVQAAVSKESPQS